MANENQLFSLEEIFSKSIFRIPDYQRGYAWGEGQLKDFWEDLVNLPDKLNHYTGMLSLERIQAEVYSSWTEEKWLIEDKDYSAYYVVDGQQRLTTIVIFVQCFVDFIHSINDNQGKDDRDIFVDDEPLDQIISRYLYAINKKHSTLCAYKFGYCDEPSYNYVKKVIMGRKIAGSVEETFYTFNLSKAKEFFDKNISSYYETYGLEALEKIFVKAINRFKFKLHYIDEDFDVYAAFETMNNRGKKLSNLELLKSRLIYLTTLFTEEQITNDERKKLRSDINSAWKEIYKWLGRKKEAPLSDNEFLRAHWILKYQFSSKRGNDYASFLLNQEFTVKNVVDLHAIPVGKEIVEDTNIEDIFVVGDLESEEDVSESIGYEKNSSSKLKPEYITDYVISLSNMAEHWFYVNYPMDSIYTEEEKIWIDRLNRIGFAYFRPLVVASFMREDIKAEERIILFKEIERFIFLAFRMSGAYANYHQNEVNKLVRQFYAKEKDISEVIQNIHNRIEGWVHAETSFDAKPFISKIQRLYSDGNGYYAWGALRYFLYEYERHLTDEAKDISMLVPWQMKSATNEISIEHIYPQNPETTSEWINMFKKYDEMQKKYLRGSLGNLLLLSVSKNAKLQNDDYSDKKNGRKNNDGIEVYKGYRKGSHSETEVAVSYNIWDAHSILKRGLELLTFMEKRWNIKFVDEQAKKEVLFLTFVE